LQLGFEELLLQFCVCEREKDVLVRGPRVCVRGNVCMRMCVWVCVMSMCVWVCVNEYVRMSMCVWVCVNEYVCMSMCVWVCVKEYVCARKMFSFGGHTHISRVCVYEYVCVSMCVSVFVYEYVRARSCDATG